MPLPSVGRIVHWQPPSVIDIGGEVQRPPHPAVITEIPTEAADPFTVGLRVWSPEGDRILRTVRYAERPTPGYWSWPPRT